MPDVVIHSETLTIFCDGHHPLSAHPRIYLNLEKTGRAMCPYCSCTYLFENKDTIDIKDQKNS